MEGPRTVGEKLKALREHFGQSQREFAALLGINPSTYVTYETRPNARPKEPALRTMGERFGLAYAWFLDGETGPPPIPRDHREAERAAGNLAAVAPQELTDEEDDFAAGARIAVPAWQGVLANLDETHFIEEKRPRRVSVPPFFFSRKNAARFVVGLPKGRSMAPRIVAPDRLIVLLAADAPPNAIVVARRADEVNFVKVLRQDAMGVKSLHSINPDFPPILDLAGWLLKGVVVGIWKPYVHDGPNIEFNGGMALRA